MEQHMTSETVRWDTGAIRGLVTSDDYTSARDEMVTKLEDAEKRASSSAEGDGAPRPEALLELWNLLGELWEGCVRAAWPQTVLTLKGLSLEDTTLDDIGGAAGRHEEIMALRSRIVRVTSAFLDSAAAQDLAGTPLAARSTLLAVLAARRETPADAESGKAVSDARKVLGSPLAPRGAAGGRVRFSSCLTDGGVDAAGLSAEVSSFVSTHRDSQASFLFLIEDGRGARGTGSAGRSAAFCESQWVSPETVERLSDFCRYVATTLLPDGASSLVPLLSEETRECRFTTTVATDALAAAFDAADVRLAGTLRDALRERRIEFHTDFASGEEGLSFRSGRGGGYVYAPSPTTPAGTARLAHLVGSVHVQSLLEGTHELARVASQAALLVPGYYAELVYLRAASGSKDRDVRDAVRSRRRAFVVREFLLREVERTFAALLADTPRGHAVTADDADGLYDRAVREASGERASGSGLGSAGWMSATGLYDPSPLATVRSALAAVVGLVASADSGTGLTDGFVRSIGTSSFEDAAAELGVDVRTDGFWVKAAEEARRFV